MYYSKSWAFISLVQFTVLFVSGQTVPECALECIADAPRDGCSPTDNVCLCESSVFIASVEACIQATCQGDDLTNAEAFITDTCDAVGVTSLPTASPTAS